MTEAVEEVVAPPQQPCEPTTKQQKKKRRLIDPSAPPRTRAKRAANAPSFTDVEEPVPTRPCGMSAAELWPNDATASMSEYSQYLNSLKPIELDLISATGQYALPPLDMVVPLAPSIARRVELLGDVVVGLAVVCKPPAIAGVETGRVKWTTEKEYCPIVLSPTVAATGKINEPYRRPCATGLNSISQQQDMVRMRPAHIVTNTLHYRSAQFRTIFGLSEQDTTAPWVHRAWLAFLAHPEWIANLRREKILGSSLHGPFAGYLEWGISILKIKDRRRVVLGRGGKNHARVDPCTEVFGLSHSLEEKVGIPKQRLGRFPRDKHLIMSAFGRKVNPKSQAVVNNIMWQWCGGCCQIIDKIGLCCGNFWFNQDVWNRL